MDAAEMKAKLNGGECDETFSYLYACTPEEAVKYRERAEDALMNFEKIYGAGRDVFLFSAPGRTEIGGNHTDHQHGCVLAAGVNMDVIAVVAKNNDTAIHVQSRGFTEDVLDASETEMQEEEKNTSVSLVRGMVAKFAEMGCRVGGFDAYTTSNVLSGSGLSSSAAFEVLIGTILNTLYFGGKASAVKIAQIAQFAENKYFGKPSGLMDQAASSVGGFIAIDFKDTENPAVQKINYDIQKSGYALCIIDTKGSHADLTPDYAAVPAEMKTIASYFDKKVLREVTEEEFYAELPQMRGRVSDRAILRAIHFFAENRRAQEEAAALQSDNFDEFKRLVIESGRSSFCYLQNVYSPAHPMEQGVSLVLALCERLLAPKGGAWRVHGGGFAGTVQTFVPVDYLPEFVVEIERVLGSGSCHVLQIRPVGGTRIL